MNKLPPSRTTCQDLGVVRGSVFLTAVLALTACGEAVAKPKPAAHGPSAKETSNQAIADKPVDIVSMQRTGLVGALERPSSLKRFFETLAKLEAGTLEDDVRALHFGDSHTAADVETGAIRRALQARFGDGGRGYVPIGRPWKRYYMEGVRVGMSNEFEPQKAKLDKGTQRLVGDGMYGLSGVGVITHQAGARAWTDITAKTSRAEIDYLEQPSGGSFDVFVDGVRVVRISTKGERTTSAFRAFDVLETAPHQLEVRAVGDGEVRVFGAILDRAQKGVVYDTLGIGGYQIGHILHWNEQHWAEQLRHRAPALVVLAYGTNESAQTDMSQTTYERLLVNALGRIARAVPTASCLLLGPPDRAIPSPDSKDKENKVWVTAPKLLEIIQTQKRVAEAAGCAFYDQFTAMGGEGSMAAWAAEAPPRGQKDRVHLTKEGYVQLGTAFASDLMRAYATWRKESGLPPSVSPVQRDSEPVSAPVAPQPARVDTSDP